MKLSTVLAALLLSASANAWKFYWIDPRDRRHEENHRGDWNCDSIDHRKGKRYEWDRDRRSSCCIHFYPDHECHQHEVGSYCSDQSGNAPWDIYAYSVHCPSGDVADEI
jgi:hypothetical protein